MNILFVIPYYVPAYSYGGPVKVAHDLAKEFVKKGHKVTVVTTDVHDSTSRNKIKEEEIDGVKIIRFRNFSNYLAKKFNAYLPFGFKKWVKQNIKNYDIIHCHDFFTYQNIVISQYSKKHNSPYILQPHGCVDVISQKSKLYFIKRLFLSLFKNILLNAKYIIALTCREEQVIINLNQNLRSKIRVIPNGINLKERSNLHKINLHQKYNIPQNHKIIVFLGRIQYIKGLDISLKALAKIKDKIDFTFLIVGPNEGEKRKLKSLAAELGLEKNVIFTGILTGQDKLNTLKSSDLFLFNSRSEGFGLTIIEACACGLPVIISDNCPIPEVQTMQAGIITKNNPAEVSEKLLSIMSNSKQLNAYKKNAIKISEHYSLESSFQKMLSLYKDVVDTN